MVSGWIWVQEDTYKTWPEREREREWERQTEVKIKLIIMRNVAEVGYEEGQVRGTYIPINQEKEEAS